MGNETFASALDRIVYKHLDVVMGEVTVSTPPNSDRYELDFLDGAVKIVQDLSSRSVLTVTLYGTEVYRRVDGRTCVCRPGAWMRPVVDRSLELEAAKAKADFEDAFSHAVARADAFTPV